MPSPVELTFVQDVNHDVLQGDEAVEAPHFGADPYGPRRGASTAPGALDGLPLAPVAAGPLRLGGRPLAGHAVPCGCKRHPDLPPLPVGGYRTNVRFIVIGHDDHRSSNPTAKGWSYGL